jgi:hypothetical protein
MKLDHLEHTDREYPEDSIVRLYAFEPSEVVQLLDLFRNLADNPGVAVQLDEVPLVQSIGGCRILLKCGETDSGITKLAGYKNSFECTLTAEGWRHAAYLAEWFTVKREPNTYQWLYDLDTHIDFLLSPVGVW